jgi:carbon monoxide dehydrogenase subunit G
MELEHSFTVPVPEERAWEVLLDVERVAPCMPGASLDSVEGDDISGRIKVKVGPIAMTYAGTARFTERDPGAHVITLEAAGKETRGAGTASATVRSKLDGQGDQTHVTVHTTLNVTGRPAQFGRGVMAEVGGRLIGIFAGNLADMLSADQPPGGPAGPAAAADGSAAAGSTLAGSAAGGSAAQSAAASPASQHTDSPGPGQAGNSHAPGADQASQLAARSADDLLAVENIGPASVTEIREKLAALGLSLSDSPAAAGSAAASSAAQAGTPAEAPSAGAPPAAAPATAADGDRASANGRPADTAAAHAAPPFQPRMDHRPPDEDAIDLLSVAGLPVLKRALPVAGALVLVLLVVLGLRRRKRSRA